MTTARSCVSSQPMGSLKMGIDEHLRITEEGKAGKLAIFIIDNQPIFRQGIRQILSSYQDMEVVGECGFTADAWSHVESLSPDVALVDIATPLTNEFGLAHQIAIRCPKVAVVILAPSPDDDQLFQAIKAGAVAFLKKDISADELASTLTKVRQGEYPINDSLLSRAGAAKQVLQLFHSLSLTSNGVESLLTPLSRRETEILKYIAEGTPNKRIAYALNISEQTIKNHVTSIMRKLSANDRTHAVVLAIRKGWLSIEEVSDIPVGEELATSA